METASFDAIVTRREVQERILLLTGSLVYYLDGPAVLEASQDMHCSRQRDGLLNENGIISRAKYAERPAINKLNQVLFLTA